MKKFNLLIMPVSLAVFFTACDLEVKDNMPDEGSLVGSWTLASVKSYSNEDCSGTGTTITGFSGSLVYTASGLTINSSSNWTFNNYCDNMDGDMVDGSCTYQDPSGSSVTINAEGWQTLCTGAMGGLFTSSNECQVDESSTFTYTYNASTGAYCETDSYGDEECGTVQVDGNQASITFPDAEYGTCMKLTMVYDLQ